MCLMLQIDHNQKLIDFWFSHIDDKKKKTKDNEQQSFKVVSQPKDICVRIYYFIIETVG